MADTTFTDKTTVVPTEWIQNVNDRVYKDAENVKGDEYGAVGDGVTDDYLAISNADTAGHVLVPSGTYSIQSNITISNDVVFLPGAILKPASGVTITINGAIQAGLWQIFDLSAGGSIGGTLNGATVNVGWFGAVGDGATDDTSAIQSALDTGLSVYFVEGQYPANNLTASTDGQVLTADAGVNVRIIKNADGPIITFSGDDQQANGIRFQGESASPAYTGDNISATGGNFKLINCGSRWAYGRAVKATGGHVRILGTNDIYQTADATATGYDIEIGASGTATLYHELNGIYTSQNTGGIKLIDVGSHKIIGGQFGKLYISSGTSPAGVNGGNMVGNRILGAVDIELSNAILIGCLLGASATLTFASGTSYCSFDESNITSGAAVTNNGNANNIIIRQVNAGSSLGFRYGDDSAIAKHIDFLPNGPIEIYHNFRLPASTSLQFTNGVGGYNNVVNATTANTFLGNASLGLNFLGSNTETYTPINVSTDRAFDADTVAVDELADVVGTMIADLQTLGLLD